MKMKVYPKHCNSFQYLMDGDQKLMMHGGEILSIADKCAAISIEEYYSNHSIDIINQYVDVVCLTVGVDRCQFFDAPKCGDIIEFIPKVLTPNTDHKIVCEVEVKSYGKKMFSGYFSFCTFIYNEEKYKYQLYPHGLNK